MKGKFKGGIEEKPEGKNKGDISNGKRRPLRAFAFDFFPAIYHLFPCMYTFLIIVLGLVAVVLTGFSWFRNVELIQKRLKHKDFNPSDLYVDYPIRLVWLIYITVFSFGFIFNNL